MLVFCCLLKQQNKMLGQELLPSQDFFHLNSFQISENTMIFQISAKKLEASCPKCSTKTTRIHSRYLRHPADVACSGRTVRFVLQTHTISAKCVMVWLLSFVEGGRRCHRSKEPLKRGRTRKSLQALCEFSRKKPLARGLVDCTRQANRRDLRDVGDFGSLGEADRETIQRARP